MQNEIRSSKTITDSRFTIYEHMNIDFEIFEEGPVVQTTDQPHVTINKLGHIFLNRHAHALIGNPEFVTLMYDRKRQIIGLMPSDRRRTHTFPLRKKDGVTSRGRMLHIMNFCRRYSIRPTETLAFTNPAVNNNGILVLSLHDVRSVSKA
jgi:hypothetical protein